MLNNIKDIEFLDKNDLGEGAYSRVFRVKHTQTKKIYALKHVFIIRLICLNWAKKTAKIYGMK